MDPWMRHNKLQRFDGATVNGIGKEAIQPEITNVNPVQPSRVAKDLGH